MEKPNTRLHDENNGLDYVLVGDYYFPALILAEDSRPVGRWGRMYKRYLKEHHSARYQALLLSGRLNNYLADIDAQAEEQLELLTQQMAEREGVNEELKAANQMEWVQRMNRMEPERIADFRTRKYAEEQILCLRKNIIGAIKSLLSRGTQFFYIPEVKKAAIEQIKEDSRPSVLQKLHRRQEEINQREQTCTKPKKRSHGIEL